MLIGRGAEEDEAEQYATALAGLLSDPERRRAMGQHGRQRIQNHFRLEQMTDRLLAAYHAARQERETASRLVPGVGLGRRVPAKRSNTCVSRPSPTGSGRNRGQVWA